MRNHEAPAPVLPRVLVSGTVAERPWGATLAAIGLSGRTGQVTLRAAAGQRFRIAFVGGLPLGATSPAPADTVARIALAERLISAVQARQFARVEDVLRLALLVGLPLAQQVQLGRRVILQRIARTFTVDEGAYVVEERIGIPVLPGIDIDIRAAIYAGMRQHVSAPRLADTVRRVGASRLVLRASGEGDLERFGLGDDALPVLVALRAGTTLPELLARNASLDPRLAEALVCSLAVCDALVPAPAPAPLDVRSAVTVALPRVPTPRDPVGPRRGPPPIPPPRRGVRPSQGASQDASQGPSRSPSRVVVAPRRATDPFLEAAPTRVHVGLTAAQVRALIAVGAERLARGVDHFTFLGLPIGAPVEAVRRAYIEFARYLHPDRLADRGLADLDRTAQAVFGRVVTAFTVLTDPRRRGDYLASLVERTPRE